MLGSVRITLEEGDRIALERQGGGAYALRIFRNETDLGLLTNPGPPGNPQGRLQTIDRDTTLIIEGNARNSTISIPGNIDFAPRIQVSTNAPLAITDGAFTLARESTQPAIVMTTVNPIGNARLSMGGLGDDDRFPGTVRVMDFQQANATRRSVAIEDGAPGIQVTNPNTNATLFTLSGRDSLEQNARDLRTAPATPPTPSTPTPPAVSAPPAPSAERPAPDAPLNNRQLTLARSEATRIRNLGAIAQNSIPAVREAYNNINQAAEAIRNGTPTQQDLQNLRESITTEVTNLQRIGQENPATATAVNILTSSLGAAIKGIDRIAEMPEGPAPSTSSPPPQGRPELQQRNQANNQIQELAGRIATNAETIGREAGRAGNRRMAQLMRSLNQSAEAARTNPTPEAVEALNGSLNNAIGFLEQHTNRPRAAMNLQTLKNFRDDLDKLASPSPQMGAAGAGLPEQAMLAAQSAVTFTTQPQQGMNSDHNSIRLSSAIPNRGGQIQIS